MLEHGLHIAHFQEFDCKCSITLMDILSARVFCSDLRVVLFSILPLPPRDPGERDSGDTRGGADRLERGVVGGTLELKFSIISIWIIDMALSQPFLKLLK